MNSQKENYIKTIGQTICDATTQFVIFGTDDFASNFYSRYKNEINITDVYGECDDTGDFCFSTVKSETEIPLFSAKAKIVIIAMRRNKEINKLSQKLIALGYCENESFFKAREFEEIYQAFANKKVYMRYAEIMVTEHCTLRCRNCCLFMPYYSTPLHMSLEEVKKNVDLFFAKVDYLFHFRILGGEPLLHPEISDIIEYICRQYREKIDYFDIATNATLMPQAKLLDCCRENDISFAVSDYSIGAGSKVHPKKVVSLLRESGVSYQHNVFDKWYDLRFPFISDPENDKGKIVECFEACQSLWRNIYDGKLFFCNVSTGAHRLGYICNDKEGYISLDEDFSAVDMLMFNRGCNNRGHLLFCAHCGGYMPNANKVLVDAAQQIGHDVAKTVIEKAMDGNGNFLNDLL